MCCLELQRRLLQINWPAELLCHELCEQVVVSMPQPDGQLEDQVVMRGFRMKMGIDCGGVMGSVHPITGCITYRGKVMNRAARITSAAASGQLLCSSEVWAAAADSEMLLKDGVDADSAGLYQLKGLPGKLELFSCRYQPGNQVARQLCEQRPDELSYPYNLPTVDAAVDLTVALQEVVQSLNLQGADRRNAGVMQRASLRCEVALPPDSMDSTEAQRRSSTAHHVPASKLDAGALAAAEVAAQAADPLTGPKAASTQPDISTAPEAENLGPSMCAEEMLKMREEPRSVAGASRRSWWLQGMHRLLVVSGAVPNKQPQPAAGTKTEVSHRAELARERNVVEAVQLRSPNRTRSVATSGRSSMANYTEAERSSLDAQVTSSTQGLSKCSTSSTLKRYSLRNSFTATEDVFTLPIPDALTLNPGAAASLRAQDNQPWETPGSSGSGPESTGRVYRSSGWHPAVQSLSPTTPAAAGPRATLQSPAELLDGMGGAWEVVDDAGAVSQAPLHPTQPLSAIIEGPAED